MSKKTEMTTAAAARIQATGAKAGNGQTAKGSFEAHCLACYKGGCSGFFTLPGRNTTRSRLILCFKFS
jgi:hypothetical protein